MTDDPAAELALLEQHANVLFDTDSRGRLTRVNEPEGDPAPRLFLARGRTASRAWLRTDVRGATVEACRRLVDELPPWDGEEPDPSVYDALRTVLAQDAPIESQSRGPAYRFAARGDMTRVAGLQVIDEPSADLLDRHFPYTRTVLAARSPVVGVVRDGAVVAACYCARKRATACEAGVATEAAFQGHGLASATVAAWRDAVERTGATPLYSTSWSNLASRAVARKLGLVAYAETFSLG